MNVACTPNRNSCFGLSRKGLLLAPAFLTGILLSSCAPMNPPSGRTVDIPAAAKAAPRQEAINEVRDSVTTIPLGEDVLVPELRPSDTLPHDRIGPFELRSETLAGALQLILANYQDVSIAFQTDAALTRQVTVANLSGTVDSVVSRLCGLADLYCTYEDGVLLVKETETFTVSLPPLGDAAYSNISSGLVAVSGASVTVDPSTRTLIYSVSQRNAEKAEKYFERLRTSTAMIVYETYIWEVQLDNANDAGINWQKLESFGDWNTGIDISSSASSQVGAPITIGLPTKGNVDLDSGDVFRFLSEQGSVKTISQPQITVLSGSEANLRVAETINYIESLARTTDDDGDETVSTTTAEVDTGFTLNIASSWDESTVYASIELEIDEFLGFQEFDAGDDDTLQLPRTSERELRTQVRSRPGDSILIAGLVRERDEYDTSGLGANTPVIPISRTGRTDNIELVILMRPRVIRYVSQHELDASHAASLLSDIQPAKKPFQLFPTQSNQITQGVDIDSLLNPSTAKPSDSDAGNKGDKL